VAECRKLKAYGFRLALDDFLWKPGIEPLVELADYIKVDFSLSGAAERKTLLRRLKKVSVALIAEKVETQQEQAQAAAEGFVLFQGYYFCRPVLMENRKVPANRLSQIEILQLLRDDSLQLQKLTQAVKRDASLTYRLLRLVNSPMCAVRQEVTSIRSALLAVGEETFRRVATLAITSEMCSGQPAEILRMAFVRGRFCELAAGMAGMDSTEQYLLGMLSLLPAMLRVAMEELTPQLPLRTEIRLALEGKKSREGVLLEWLQLYERGEWEACDAVVQTWELNAEELVMCYTEAVHWAESTLLASA
jgi:EAL and modified HD-GYP domain-containing signal transduction protein